MLKIVILYVTACGVCSINFIENFNNINLSKVATTRTEDGHKQNTKTSVAI